MHGTVRSLTDYGAFVDIGGVDGLLHVADISWGHVNKPADVLSVGQEVDVKILKVDPPSGALRWAEAASAASLGTGWREVQDRRPGARHGHARDGFRRVSWSWSRAWKG
jgi:predicted RNA-binding protein with RPS1 domain